MGKVFDMCDVCKLDKASICNYECVKKHSDFMFRFFTCPRFIYDDGQPMTNAELLSTDIKDDIELAATSLWYQLAMDGGFETYEDFVKWLKDKAIID